MRRRDLIMLFGGVAAAWPLAAQTQQRAKPARIGYLSSSSPPDVNLESFIRGMGAVGYGEGRDFVIEARYARRDYSKFPPAGRRIAECKSGPHRRGRPRFPDLATGRSTGSSSVPVQRRSGGCRHRREL